MSSSSFFLLYPSSPLFSLLPLPPSSCVLAVLVAASDVGMVLQCRSHFVGIESSPPSAESNCLCTAKLPRDGLRTSEKETKLAVLTSTAMVMAEVVTSEKLCGACSRRRRWTPTAGGGRLLSHASEKKLGWRPAASGQRGPHRRGPGGDGSGKLNPWAVELQDGRRRQDKVVFSGGADRR
uniref:Uncharacterized protein n=1 Tax=Oryza glumipatula TaxID=40148 RepID=A0A0D9ZPJ0_9ORYZ